MTDVFIFDALRTPRGKGVGPAKGKPGGALHSLAPQELIHQLVAALQRRNGEDFSPQVARLLLGCVGQVDSQGGHLALVSRIASGLAENVVPKTINNYCVSGLSSVIEGVRWSQAGEGGLTLAGGVEMLSQVPFQGDRGSYYCDPKTSSQLNWLAPIMGAEILASQMGYSKADLDEATVRSHQRAAKAFSGGKYAGSVMPVRDPAGEVMLGHDEWVRGELTLDDLERRSPAFVELGQAGQDQRALAAFPELNAIDHVHSVANCPGLADGAALVVTGSAEAGRRAGLEPRARVVAAVETAGDPVLQFGAGFQAMEQVLRKSGLSLPELDRIEFMEAFAAVPVHFERRYQPDMSRVNVNGGHLAMGHPMGATGAVLLTTLVHELEHSDLGLGMVVALAGGGLGAAMIIERI